MFCKNDERFNLYFYDKEIEEGLSYEVTKAHPFDLLVPKTDNGKLSGVNSIPAAGLALRGIRKLPVQMNLMPPHLRKKLDKTSLVVMMALAVVFSVSLIFLAVTHVINQRAITAGLDQKLEKLRSEAANVEKMQSETQHIQNRINYLHSLRPGGVFVSDILKELTARIPMTAWVKELRLSGNEVSIYGVAESASELIPLLDASPIFTDVKFLSTIRKDRDDKEIFRIGLQIRHP
jgi:general secretion pathway protein L